MFFYLLIIIVIIIILIPDGRPKKENFLIDLAKKNVLGKVDDLSKYLIL
jgi:hypothetical protein